VTRTLCAGIIAAALWATLLTVFAVAIDGPTAAHNHVTTDQTAGATP